MKMRPAIGRLEFAVLPKPRCAGMIEAGARPEDAHVVLDLLVSDAEVIGGAAFGSDAQLVENLLDEVQGEMFLRPQPLRDFQQDLVSVRALPGGVTAFRMRMTRPSAVVTVPSSSSWSEPGRMRLAWWAVSLRKKSMHT